MRLALLFLMLVATNIIADTQIHRCLLEDGTYSFQEKPCIDTAAISDDANDASEETATDDSGLDFVNPFDQPEGLAPQEQPPQPVRPSADRAKCEKSTRDAIDAIDLEMRETSYSEEQGKRYLAELLKLTRQLRECKSQEST